MKNQDCIISPTRRERFETQGYIGHTDTELNDFKFGIRFAYYLCGSLVIIGLLTTNLKVLSAAMIVTFFGTLLLRKQNSVRQYITIGSNIFFFFV